MANKLELLKPVLHHSSGNTIGGEPKFSAHDIAAVIDACTDNGIAIVGLDLFRDTAQGYVTERLSAYEVPWQGSSWSDFVARNNTLAKKFAAENLGGQSYFYLLTPATQEHYLGRA